MGCADFATYQEFWVNGQFFDAVWCPYADQLGQAIIALMFFGTIAMALYIYSGSVVVPLVLVMIVGSVILVQLPAGIVQFVGIVLVLGIPAALWLLIHYVRRRAGA